MKVTRFLSLLSFRAIAIGLALGFVGVLYSAWVQAAPPLPRGTFIIGQDYDFSSIDPSKANAGPQLVVTHAALVQTNFYDYRHMPDLAASWSVLSPTAWKFNIRKGVTFHNGQPLTSADVQYSFYRQMGKLNPRFPGANRPTWQKLVDRIETPDDHTMILHTKSPDAALLSVIRWMFIVPKAYIEKVGDDAYSQMPVGTGPYVIKERKIGEFLTLEAYPDYWNVNPEKGTRGHGKVKTIILRSMPKEQTRVAALRAGEIQGTGISQDTVQTFENDKNFNVYYSPINQSLFLMFNWREEKDPKTGEPNPLTDVRVRRALNHAVDVNALIKNYLTGRENRTTLLGKDGIGFNPKVPFYAYDPEKAKKLLAEAGYTKGFKTTFFTAQDMPPYTGALLQYLRDIGLQIEIKQTTPAVAMTNMSNKSLYGMLLWGGGLGGPDPAATFFKTCISYDGNWAVHGRNDQVEDLVQKQMVEFNEAKRAKLIDDVIQILWRDAWFVPLFEPVFIKVASANWNYSNPPASANFNLTEISPK